MQFDLIGNAILGIEHAEVMDFRCHARIVQKDDGGVYLSSLWMVSDEKGVICIVDGQVSKMPHCSCM